MPAPSLIRAAALDELLAGSGPLVGFWGVPPREAIREHSEDGALQLVDLDVHRGAPATRILPEAYCHIIRNCVDNAAALAPRLKRVIAAVGTEKCDAARYAAWVLRERLEIPVVEVTHPGLAQPAEPLLSEARGPLKRRVVRMMEASVEPLDDAEQEAARSARCRPTHGFWGTPPHPIELLDLFPETTHVFGWTRAVEQGRPADLGIEARVPDDLPIVFFSQGFCAKSQLARQLAERHRGMHLDVHDSVGAATTAKIEAFIRLTGGNR